MPKICRKNVARGREQLRATHIYMPYIHTYSAKLGLQFCTVHWLPLEAAYILRILQTNFFSFSSGEILLSALLPLLSTPSFYKAHIVVDIFVYLIKKTVIL